jgi:hypothetical protein
MNDELDSTKRAWTADERRKLAAGEIKGGFAGPDQSFPIAGPADVGDAWGLAGQAANPDQVRRKIISIARKFGWLGSLPASATKWAEDNGVSIKTGELTGDEDEDETTKAGRRLAGAKLAQVQAAMATLNAAVKWMAYEDGEDVSEDTAEEKAIKALDEYAVKALGNDRIGGFAVLWGDQRRKDVTGEYFSKATTELDAIFTVLHKLPVLYGHGSDDALKTTVVGSVDVLQANDIGLWFEAQLAIAGKYKDAILDLVDRGVLGVSSGTLPRARKVAPDGLIQRWPIAEISLTPTPAEPRMMTRPVAAIKAAYDELGITLPDDDDQAKGAENARQIEIEMEQIELLKLR